LKLLSKLRFSRGPAARLKAFSAIGVVAAAILAVNVNVLVARRYARWDLTQDGLYTLSEPTKRTLRSLSEPVEVLVLMSRVDPLLVGARHLLSAYGAETSNLAVRFIDPEQNPAEFSAVQNKYGVNTGSLTNGRLVTDANFVIARGDRHWFITAEDMMRFDADTGRARSRLEQALTEGIVNVLDGEKPLACFTRGHQEAGLDDAGPDGLAELRSRLEKSNYRVEARDLPGVSREPLADCRLIVIAGPRLAFSAADAGHVSGAVQRGAGALLLLGPVVGESGALSATGLESALALAGAALGKNLILELDPDARLPRGMGEVFFAAPSGHEVTEGLGRGSGKLAFRPLLSQVQEVRPLGDEAKPLLLSSDRAVAVTDVGPLLHGSVEDATRGARAARYVLAVARELNKPEGIAHSPRLVVAGSSTLASNRSYRDAALYANTVLIENAVSWLAARPALVSVPEKAETEVGLALTEESLGEVLRYVVVYMPLSAAVLGIFVILRRRAVEKRSRRSESDKAKDEARA